MRSDDIPNVTLLASDDAWSRCMERKPRFGHSSQEVKVEFFATR